MILRSLGALFLLISAIPTTVQACTCSQAPPGKCSGLQQDDVVFLGTVTSFEVSSVAAPPSDAAASPAPPVRLAHYVFRIDELFAGPADPEIDVFSGGEDGDCGYQFKKTSQYLVFTHRGTDGRLYATICSGTRPVREALAVLPQLRAMRNGKRVASVFGVLRRADAPFLAPPDDPEKPLPNVSLKLRSRDDRFETTTDSNGVYSFYDVHAGEYSFTAQLPTHVELTRRTMVGGLPPFTIPNGACYEYDVDALPTGHIQGSVLAPDGKPLSVASVELYRAGTYDDSRPGLWGFQGARGVFDLDHIGPGQYTLVFNRANRMDPNAPFPRAFYPGVADLSEAQPIKIKDGQQLTKVNIKLKEGFPVRKVRVRLKWRGARPIGDVTVTAKADGGENPAARKVGDDLYEFALLPSGSYTISAWQDLKPQRLASKCAAPARMDAPPVTVSGSDASASEIVLAFPQPDCSGK